MYFSSIITQLFQVYMSKYKMITCVLNMLSQDGNTTIIVMFCSAQLITTHGWMIFHACLHLFSFDGVVLPDLISPVSMLLSSSSYK